MPAHTVLKGRVIAFEGHPFRMPPDHAAREHEAVALGSGYVQALGSAEKLLADYPGARLVNHGENLVLAGFVDAHTHYPQTAIIASWGKRLIDWLNSYTFPEERKFHNPEYAAQIASRYLDLTMLHGTTTVCSFCTIHPTSVTALFAEAQRRSLRIVAGKTCMDRNAPEFLRDSAQSAYDDSRILLERWHGRDRLSYAITPRFAPTSTPEQLEALGCLWAKHPECLMQTHLSEQTEEIAWVRELFPRARDYLDVYERFGLLRTGAVFGHAIHLESRERDRLREAGASLAHCPTSNTFIGSGLFDMMGLMTKHLRIGLATDTGGGSNFSMLRTMAAAYEIGQLRGTALHPAQLLWLATQGSAQALGLGDRVGNLAPGMEADLVVLDTSSTPAIAQRVRMAETLWETVFPTIMMGDDRAVVEVWIKGHRSALPAYRNTHTEAPSLPN